MGWRVCVYSYWSLDFSDTSYLTDIFDHLHLKYVQSPLVAVAYSAGGHILTKYLQDAGKTSPLSAAVSNSGCFDFVSAVANVETNENPSYKIFLNSQFRIVMKRFLANEKSFRGPDPKFDAAKMLEHACAASPISGDALAEYDRMIYNFGAYTGKNDVEHNILPYQLQKQTASHYNTAAALGMDKIRVTTLILQADDDPIVNGDHYDPIESIENKHIILCHTKRGGHVSWYEGSTVRIYIYLFFFCCMVAHSLVISLIPYSHSVLLGQTGRPYHFSLLCLK